MIGAVKLVAAGAEIAGVLGASGVFIGVVGRAGANAGIDELLGAGAGVCSPPIADAGGVGNIPCVCKGFDRPLPPAFSALEILSASFDTC